MGFCGLQYMVKSRYLKFILLDSEVYRAEILLFFIDWLVTGLATCGKFREIYNKLLTDWLHKVGLPLSLHEFLVKRKTSGFINRTSLGASMPWYGAWCAALCRILTYITYHTSVLSTALELIQGFLPHAQLHTINLFSESKAIVKHCLDQKNDRIWPHKDTHSAA